MTEKQIEANGLRVSIEMGAEFERSERLTEAIEELALALAEENGSDDDVQGFGQQQFGLPVGKGFSMNFEKIEARGGGQSNAYIKFDGVDGNAFLKDSDIRY